MDDVDRAQAHQEAELSAQLERAVAMARQALGRSTGRTTCAACGEPIEGPRLVYGFVTCASCAREAEYYSEHGRTYR